MPDIQKIVALADFSSASTLALKYACSTSRMFDARIGLVHVIAEPVPTMYPYPVPSPESAKTHVDESLKKLSAMLEEVPGCSGVECERIVRRGHVVEELLGAVGALQPDLIAMGTHGRTGLIRRLMGSVTKKVLATASCPVLTTVDSGATGKSAANVNLKMILLATDLRGPAESPLWKLAARFTDAFKAQLTILHAVDSSASEAHRAAAGKGLVKVEHAVLSQLKHQLHVTSVVHEGKPGDVILHHAGLHDFDAIMIGLPRRKLLEKIVTGSSVDSVVAGSHVAVISVPLEQTD
jgi:nucleotide-binding universal stress UspA family protein